MDIKIIITDNHQLFLDGIKAIFSKINDISVIGEASNGLELVKLLESGMRPDVIITEIRMPIIDGISVTNILSKDYPKIPVLALSMYKQDTYVLKMLAAGAKGYLNKSSHKKELVQAIRTLANGDYYYKNNSSHKIEYRHQKTKKISKKPLTHRENEVLSLLARGKTTIQIAKKLIISRFTVDTHRKNIHKKLGIKTNTGLVNYALKNLHLDF